MSNFPLKANHKPVKNYYTALQHFRTHGFTTEGNTRAAFADLLRRAASAYDWHLVEEYRFKGTGKQDLRADGALVDDLTLQHGIWEAKDTNDDLEKEVKAKAAKGYPLINTLFQSPARAILYQDNRIALDCDLNDPAKLMEALGMFFEHRQAHEVDWEEAVTKFSEKIPDLANGVTAILEKEYAKNSEFRERFQAFAELCRQSINPDLTDDAIRKMLVQHLLTERIFRKVFSNPEFTKRNVIAAEIEKVIASITAKHFSRDTFLQPLDRFYKAIEEAAATQTSYTEKQHFLNAVYEKFFKSFDPKQADTHGIVYTPQPIVDFMVRSVEEVLQSEFGKSLSDENVHILDPFTGTGNFITRIMRQIKKSRLPQKYANELHCNEIMLLPYYIASMNIEHAYLESLGHYEAFEGICLADTFDLGKKQKPSLFNEENSERVRREENATITVIVGNPPYNTGRKRAADLNKNRKYPDLDKRVKNSYGKSQRARKLKLRDPFVRAIKWASDRIPDDGIVAYITNSAYLTKFGYDAMRGGLGQEFDRILICDLGGDVRENPKLSGTTHNVFGIQLGVAIAFLIRSRPNHRANLPEIRYVRMDEFWRREAKFSQLENWGSVKGVPWSEIVPDSQYTWLKKIRNNREREFQLFVPLTGAGVRGEKAPSISSTTGPGISTNRDPVAYSFRENVLMDKIRKFAKLYNKAIEGYVLAGRPDDVDNFTSAVPIPWSRNLKRHMVSGDRVSVEADAVKVAQYRPFASRLLYAKKIVVDEPGKVFNWFSGDSNTVIAFSGKASTKCFSALAMSTLPCLDCLEKTQCFPFYNYEKDRTSRHENITDWTLTEFRAQYGDKKIGKWDIFHYTYGLLHHPGYRERYAANLKRELPRLPYAPDFHSFAKAGKRLMELHVDYEKQKEYRLDEIETPKVPWTLRVEKMRLSKDKSEIKYNQALTLRGIPAKVFEYRLGNRSALEWVIDQYQVSTDKRSGIVNDPNREDDESYILKLIGKVITVSVETVDIVNALAKLPFRPEEV